jgi:hypothetical protein
MPTFAKFATGKYAKGICDVCGVAYMLNELRGTTIRGKPTGILACPICWDPDHPQNFLPFALTVDAEALRVARPEDFGPSRAMVCVFETDSIVATFSVGSVEVTVT